ncbi:hypothetical protein CWI84_04515 [Idiomarina tyrosinivorans]|uniref:DUF4156 domain-containing protein n=1 Tax=Idiomarina tyrosinivorans TaxID=1445662 RepID=A0A432ZSK1_9GAMM|nr:hypothetical protein [Idiomarina tyrosinivorans]RUO80853.1 hypothetical protein CWI84_04515 [Idiomarina tyrosinivorans]
MTIQQYFTGVVLAALLAGCASEPSVVMLGTKHPAINPDTVQFYRQKPAEAEEIALIKASSDGSFRFGEQAEQRFVINQLRQQAAQLGANGIVLQGSEDQPDNSVSIGTGIGQRSGNVSIFLGLERAIQLSDKIAHGLAIFVPITNNTESVKSQECDHCADSTNDIDK